MCKAVHKTPGSTSRPPSRSPPMVASSRSRASPPLASSAQESAPHEVSRSVGASTPQAYPPHSALAAAAAGKFHPSSPSSLSLPSLPSLPSSPSLSSFPSSPSKKSLRSPVGMPAEIKRAAAVRISSNNSVSKNKFLRRPSCTTVALSISAKGPNVLSAKGLPLKSRVGRSVRQ